MQHGVYLSTAAGLTRIADTTTPVPDDTRNFETFGSASWMAAGLRLCGQRSKSPGIYLHDLQQVFSLAWPTRLLPFPVAPKLPTLLRCTRNRFGRQRTWPSSTIHQTQRSLSLRQYLGAISAIVTTGMPIPGGDGSFVPETTSMPSRSTMDESRFSTGGDLLQTQSPTVPPLVLEYTQTSMDHSKEVLAVETYFRQQLVTHAEIGPESLDGNQIAINVRHTGGDRNLHRHSDPRARHSRFAHCGV